MNQDRSVAVIVGWETANVISAPPVKSSELISGGWMAAGNWLRT